jgi:hypothetical protein
MTTCVSLAELAAADIQLRPAEAAAIVIEVCRQYRAGQLPGFPSPGIIRLTRDGEVVAQGPIAREAGDVARAGQLLDDLLPDFESPAEYRASGGLRLVLARALGTLDLPPYASLNEFCEALKRFTVPDLGTTARGLFRAWSREHALQPPPACAAALTISDIRRARRATGLSLDDVAAAADVPAARLRELEWGYLLNWRADDDGRSQVVRYARAAGLDEQVVLSIAWPMIEEASADAAVNAEPVLALVPSGPRALAKVERPAIRQLRAGFASVGLAAVAAALLALATVALSVESAEGRGPIEAEASNVQTPAESHEIPPDDPAAVSRPIPPEEAPAVPPSRTSSRPAAVRPTATRPAAAPQRRHTARNKSFLRRELFRIVIR